MFRSRRYPRGLSGDEAKVLRTGDENARERAKIGAEGGPEIRFWR
jgi:hypothetical protein